MLWCGGSGSRTLSHVSPTWAAQTPGLSFDTLSQANWTDGWCLSATWGDKVDDKPCNRAAILSLSQTILRYCPWRTFTGLMACSTSPRSAGHWSEMLQRRQNLLSHAFRGPLAKSSAARFAFCLNFFWGFGLISLTFCVLYLFSVF